MSFIVQIRSHDTFGLGFLQEVIRIAAVGGVLVQDTLPRLSFPQMADMIVEGDVAPTPSPMARVFEAETMKEVFTAFIEPEASEFSMEVDVSTNEGTPWTREQLSGMDFATEFKAVMAAAGIEGKKRELMTKNYLAKYAVTEVVEESTPEVVETESVEKEEVSE